MTHYLYLVRHGEHLDAEHGLEDGPLSPRGRRQAELLADRLWRVIAMCDAHCPVSDIREAVKLTAFALENPSWDRPINAEAA